ncbi:hypothetical protein AALB39_17980 [Lachnospiraceae bacterium 54-53]
MLKMAGQKGKQMEINKDNTVLSFGSSTEDIKEAMEAIRNFNHVIIGYGISKEDTAKLIETENEKLLLKEADKKTVTLIVEKNLDEEEISRIAREILVKHMILLHQYTKGTFEAGCAEYSADLNKVLLDFIHISLNL